MERGQKGKVKVKAKVYKKDLRDGKLGNSATRQPHKPGEKPVEEEDGAWMGGSSDEELKLPRASSDEEDEASGSEGGEDDGPSPIVVPGADQDISEEEGGDAGGAADDNQGSGAQSKMLARVMGGEQSSDIGELKRRIKDDAALLTNWRNAKKAGEKRTRAQVLKSLVGDCSTYFGYSDELAEYFLLMFSPEKAIEFFEANEKSRPLTIRTNSLKTRRPALVQSLTNRKVSLDPIGDWTKVGLKIYESAVPVGATPEYLGGHYMIQSASSLIPVMALAPQQDETILDMAAAPGGKTTHIGQLMRNTGTLYANDMRKERCKPLAANVHRMGLTNTIVCQLDGRKLKEHLPPLDRVLLDAPCSGSGIVSRDPSVKVKRGQKDFEEASVLQKELLAAAIDLVNAQSKTGGYIVYSTCSLSVEENEAVIEHALRTRSVELVSFSSAVNFGVEGMTKYRERRFHPTMNLCRRYYPHVHNMDGFFVAKLKKISNTIPERVKKHRSKGGEPLTTWGEEHWTPEMMETIVDPSEIKVDEEGNSKPKNKHERKKLKRKLVLAARAAVSTGVGAAAAAAAGVADVVKAKQDSATAPPSSGAAASEATPKKKGKRKSAGGGSEPATPEVSAQKAETSPAAAKAETSPASGDRKKKRRLSA